MTTFWSSEYFEFIDLDLSSDISSIVDPIITSEWLRRCYTCHCALPQHTLLVFVMLVLGQLPSDTVHDTAVMEDDQIAFFPAVGVDVLGRIDLLLHVVHHLSDFFDIVKDRYLSSSRVSCAQFKDTASVDLEEWSTRVKRVSPNHLKISVKKQLRSKSDQTHGMFRNLIPTPLRQLLNWDLAS